MNVNRPGTNGSIGISTDGMPPPFAIENQSINRYIQMNNAPAQISGTETYLSQRILPNGESYPVSLREEIFAKVVKHVKYDLHVLQFVGSVIRQGRTEGRIWMRAPGLFPQAPAGKIWEVQRSPGTTFYKGKPAPGNAAPAS